MELLGFSFTGTIGKVRSVVYPMAGSRFGRINMSRLAPVMRENERV